MAFRAIDGKSYATVLSIFMNAVEIEQAVSELAEAPFDAEEFPYAFLEAFGNKSTTLKKLRSGVPLCFP